MTSELSNSQLAEFDRNFGSRVRARGAELVTNYVILATLGYEFARELASGLRVRARVIQLIL